MALTCQERGERHKNRTSVNIDSKTQEALGILSRKQGVSKKDLVKKLVKEALHKEACAH